MGLHAIKCMISWRIGLCDEFYHRDNIKEVSEYGEMVMAEYLYLLLRVFQNISGISVCQGICCLPKGSIEPNIRVGRERLPCNGIQ